MVKPLAIEVVDGACQHFLSEFGVGMGNVFSMT